MAMLGPVPFFVTLQCYELENDASARLSCALQALATAQ